MRDVATQLAERGWTQPGFHSATPRPEVSWYARHANTAGGFHLRRSGEIGQGSLGGGGAGEAPEPTAEQVAAAALERRERKKADRRRRNQAKKAAGTRRQRRRQSEEGLSLGLAEPAA